MLFPSFVFLCLFMHYVAADSSEGSSSSELTESDEEAINFYVCLKLHPKAIAVFEKKVPGLEEALSEFDKIVQEEVANVEGNEIDDEVLVRVAREILEEAEESEEFTEEEYEAVASVVFCTGLLNILGRDAIFEGERLLLQKAMKRYM